MFVLGADVIKVEPPTGDARVLLEMGYDWDAIIALKDAGALP